MQADAHIPWTANCVCTSGTIDLSDSFPTWEEARAFMLDELERAADDYGHGAPSGRGPGSRIYEEAIPVFTAAPVDEEVSVLIADYHWSVKQAS